MRGSRVNALFAVAVFLVVVLSPLAAGAQQIPTPGAPPEEVKEWTWYMSFLVAAGAVGLVALLALSYLRLSSRFFGKEEPPAIPQRRRQPQFAGTVAAPAGPRVDQVAAASTTPPAPPAAGARTAAEQQPRSVAERSPAEERATEEEPAQKPAAGEQPAEAKAEAQAPARPAPEHVEPDQEVYERELQAQLDKGTDRRVAEGRAKAAAVRAARSKAAPQTEAKTSPEAAPAKTKPEESQPAEKEETPAPAVEKGEAETATETKSKEAGEVKEPASPEPTPEADAEEAEEPPAKVKAPRPKAEPKPSTEAPPAKAPPGADEDTFRRVLEEQLEKGLARPIAESRARAAAVKAAREKADAG